MTDHAEFRRAAGAAASQKRRELVLDSPAMFASVYLDRHFRLRPSRMHEEIFDLARAASCERSRRLAIAAPRGHAKSTVISLAYVLWAAVHEKEPYIILASATQEQAAALLRHVKDELEDNERLRTDFPGACPSLDGRRAAPWRGTKVRPPSGVVIHAVGAGQQIRGLRNAEHRPSLIIADDLEAPELVVSEDQRDKTREWFEKTLLKAGDGNTNAIIVGTVLHYDSLLSRVLDPARSPGWTSRRYKALISEPEDTAAWSTWENIYCELEQWEGISGPDGAAAYFDAHREDMLRGSEVLWPEKDPLETLMETRVREGRAAFQSEKQNEPLDPDRCVFDLDAMTYWDDEFASVEALLQHHKGSLSCWIGWDPSLGKRTGDYSAIIVIAHDRQDDISYVIVADIARRPPQEAIGRIVEYARMYNVDQIVVESNGFQEGLQKDIEATASAQGVRVGIDGVQNTGEKRGRIALLEPKMRQGKVRLSRRHTELLDQLRQFPLGSHDDAPDALEMVVKAVNEPRAEVYVFDSGPEWNTRYFHI